MGRPERALPRETGAVSAFARELRQLRYAAGNPSYRELSRRALFAPSVLSTAAAGNALPSLRVTVAFAQACGASPDVWVRKWHAVAAPAGGEKPQSIQLPPVAPHFVGREAELARLRRLLTAPSGTRPVVITGPVGSGKSALAVHCAHQLADRFPDGQVYVPLAESGGQSDVLTRVVRSIGLVPPEAADHEQLVECCRSVLAGRRMLIVLDGVVDEAQVRALARVGSGSAVLVASRSRLSGLEGVQGVALRPLPAQDARAMFGALSADLRDTEFDAVTAVLEWCEYLPLAVWLAATRLAAHPGWSIAHAARRLAEPGGRLRWLRAGDISLAERLDAAYRACSPAAQEIFQRLSVDGGGQYDVASVAASGPLPAAEVEEALEALVDSGLLMVALRTGHYFLPAVCAEFAGTTVLPRRSIRMAGNIAIASRLENSTARTISVAEIANHFTSRPTTTAANG